MRFTRDEFDTMINELLYSTPVSFDMLCSIAEKVLRPSVVNWCKDEDCLRGRGYEDDIMQEIHLRLVKTTIDYFMLRDDIEGPYNDNPEGFEDWIFFVAKNIKRDFANKIRKRNFTTDDIDDPAIGEIPSGEYEDDTEENVDRLKRAFSIVLSSEVGIYKVLTWLAQFIFILEYDVTKIKSNELIITAFENKTLYDMYDMLLKASKRIPWIVVTKEQNEKILCALRKKREGTVSYGETKYRNFFMKHNGAVSGKKSISDWMNRMNDMIRRQIEAPSFEKKSKKKTDKAEKKGGSRDEASNC